MDKLDFERAVRAYLALRAARAELAAKFEEQDGDLREQQAKLEHAMQAHMREMGAESVRTAHGLVYTQVKTSAHVCDWTSFVDWMKKTDGFDFLEQRVKRSAVEEFIAEHGEAPAGVQVLREQVVRVRKGGS